MSAFVWVDRDGRRHELESPAPIEAEAADVALEMEQYFDFLDSGDRLLRAAARAAIGKLQPRLEQLRADVGSWNEHAIAATRAEAATLAERIDRLPTMIAKVLLVVELHSEQAQLLDAMGDTSDTPARMLAEPITAIQRRAIAACASRAASIDAATRGEAKAWLDAQPRFARGVQTGDGWFAWVDRNGHAHRLADPLAIEREVVCIAEELIRLRPALASITAADRLYEAVSSAITSWERLSLLQGDLERFDREAEVREDAAWTAYAADWRSKRNIL